MILMFSKLQKTVKTKTAYVDYFCHSHDWTGNISFLDDIKQEEKSVNSNKNDKVSSQDWISGYMLKADSAFMARKLHGCVLIVLSALSMDENSHGMISQNTEIWKNIWMK